MDCLSQLKGSRRLYTCAVWYVVAVGVKCGFQLRLKRHVHAECELCDEELIKGGSCSEGVSPR